MVTFNGAARADSLYANNASFTDYIMVMEPATAAITGEFFTTSGNGRGVVVVGNTLYYTLSNSGSVYSHIDPHEQ